VFAEQAKKAGVEIRQNRIDPSSFFSPGQGFATRPFATSIYTTGTNSLATFYLASLVPGAPYNETGWGSPEDDNMLYAALAQTDETKAAALWHDVGSPFAEGRLRIRLAELLRADGDLETADLELAAAKRTFREVGLAERETESG